MQQWIIDWIGSFGILAIWWLIFLENVFPPIPSEVILTFSGFLTVQSSLSVTQAAAAATVGSVSGALVLYAAGYKLGRERVMHWLDGKAGRILHLHSQDVDKAQGWFDHHGKATVFFCRFVPLIRSLISLPAGMARMNLPGFVILTTVGSAIWNVVLILLGAWFGDAWEQVVCYLDTYAYVALSVFGAVVLVIFIWFKRRTQAAKKG